MATTNYYEEMLKKTAPANMSPTASQGGLTGDVYSQAAGQPGYGGSPGVQPGQGAAAIGNTANVTLVDDAGQRQTGLADASQPGYFDSMRNYYEEMYNSQVEANNRALENARAQAQAAADAQREALAQEYQGLNRQLYRDYMGNKRTLPQELAAQGYTGGLTESSRLRLTNAYEEALAENERARLRQAAGADQDLSLRLYNAQAAADEANQQAARDRLGYLALLLESEHQQEQQRLQDRADTLAAAGDFSAYLQLGYSQTEVDAMTRAWLARNPGMLLAWIQSHPEDAQRMGISLPAAAPASGSGGRGGRKKKSKEEEAQMNPVTDAWERLTESQLARARQETASKGKSGASSGGGSVRSNVTASVK